MQRVTINICSFELDGLRAMVLGDMASEHQRALKSLLLGIAEELSFIDDDGNPIPENLSTLN